MTTLEESLRKVFSEEKHPRDAKGRFRDSSMSLPLPPDRIITHRVPKVTDPGAKGSSSFTDSDVTALKTYFGSEKSYVLNEFLRTGHTNPVYELSDREAAKRVKGIDAVMAKVGPVGAAVKVFRGIWGGPEKLGLPADANSLKGRVFTDLGYGSTASSERQAFVWLAAAVQQGSDTIRFDLTVDPRVRAIWGANPSEDELLLEHGTRYKIIDATSKTNSVGGTQWKISAQVLPPSS